MCLLLCVQIKIHMPIWDEFKKKKPKKRNIKYKYLHGHFLTHLFFYLLTYLLK